ncbi:hypothetical protein [Deinococcus budaensis]|uniref:Uncharacterized protein n=1 Tax=Deinococcus budaensis TaxID=1665626 RepID=A0A7W8GFT2_9DEIO|nr:hypothetical protein [Deinococcus budaensis]MBB5234473.1 hypothetical protein [Deinococcus budaensis]
MTEKKSTGDRFEYTGGTAGHVVIDGQHVADVKPGDVIEARDTAHARLIKKSGQFEPTTKRATATPGPERLPEIPDATDAPAPAPTPEAPASTETA